MPTLFGMPEIPASRHRIQGVGRPRCRRGAFLFVKLFVVGLPCSGKTTIAGHLRRVSDLPIIDMDDEILSLNRGVWPSIDRKNNVLQPQVLAAVCPMRQVLLFNSYMSVERTRRLRRSGFRTMLLEVSERGLRRRNMRRIAEEGYEDASRWFAWHYSVVQALKDHHLIDHVISGERDIARIADELLAYARQ